MKPRMEMRWYADDHDVYPANQYEIVGGTMLSRTIPRSGTKDHPMLSSDMFKKLIKSSQFKNPDVLKLVAGYVKEPLDLKTEHWIVQHKKNYAISLSSYAVVQVFHELRKLIAYYQDDDYIVTPVHRMNTSIDDITFSIHRINNKGAHVLINIDLITEYVGIAQYRHCDIGLIKWYKMKDLDKEGAIESLKDTIDACIDDDTYYAKRYLGLMITTDRCKDLLKCFGLVYRNQYRDTVEHVLGDEMVFFTNEDMITERFYRYLGRLIQTNAIWMYAKPIQSLEKYLGYIDYFNKLDAKEKR